MSAPAAAPQHLQALAQANEIRLTRCRLKRKIAAMDKRTGLRHVAVLLSHPPAVLDTMLVTDLLAACHRVGSPTAHKWAGRAEVRRRRVIGELTPGERMRIVALLSGKAGA